MRTLARILIATAFALTLSSPASALVSIYFTQVGGTYNGVGPWAGETIELDISYWIDGGTMVTSIDISLDLSFLATFVSGTETGIALWENGAASVSPIGAPGTDIATVAPGVIGGWEKTAGVPWGTPGSCIWDAAPGGSCVSLGTVTISLTGLMGVAGVSLSNSLILDATFQDITASQVLGTFAIIPEPTSASLLGLGLLGLTVASRRRKQ